MIRAPDVDGRCLHPPWPRPLVEAAIPPDTSDAISDRSSGELYMIAGACRMDLVPLITAVLSVVVGAGGATLLIREYPWLRYCRYVHDVAVVKGQNPDPEKMIRAASAGRLGRSSNRPALPSSPKSDDTSLAA
jgi:hypothetical protein